MSLSLLYFVFFLYASFSARISEGTPLDHGDQPAEPCPIDHGADPTIKDPVIENSQDSPPQARQGGNQELIVCRSCATVRCNLQEADTNAEKCKEEGGIIDPKGGFCGCCPICVIQLKEGDGCAITQIRGVPARAKCGEGLKCCSETEKCQKAKTEC